MRLILPRAVGRELDDLRVDARSCPAALVRCIHATALRFVISPSRPIVNASPPAMTVIRGVQMQRRSEEHTSELQSLMRISYAVFCLKKKKTNPNSRIKSNTH